MTKKLTSSDIYDINRNTGALILGKNRLDDYATKYLTKHCKEALLTPMPLPVEKIFEEAKLTVKEVSLSRNLDIFGCCLLLDGEVDVYDTNNGTSRSESFPAGTILIDPASEAVYGEGAKRNTLIHEALHWEKDKRYFEILALKNAVASEKLYPIMCRQSETFFEPPEGKKTKENEVKWLEWQAHRLAPRVLMPFEMFKKKTLELICGYQSPQNDVVPSCDTLIEDLSSFFIVSRVSVKYRLIEVGLLDKLRDFNDFDAVFAEVTENKELVALTPLEAYQLLAESSSLREWVRDGRFVYADGYFVLAEKQYVLITSFVKPALDFSARTFLTSSSVIAFFSTFGAAFAFVLGSSAVSPLAIASAKTCRLSPSERISSITSNNSFTLLICLSTSFDFMNFHRFDTLSG